MDKEEVMGVIIFALMHQLKITAITLSKQTYAEIHAQYAPQPIDIRFNVTSEEIEVDLIGPASRSG